MKNFDIKKMLSWLGVVLRCPVCSHKYNQGSTKIIESHQDEVMGEANLLIHSDCQKCKSSVVFSIDISGPEVSSAAMVTDLTSRDTARFNKAEPIHTNEVIGIHKELQAFDGDLVKALKK